MRKPYIILNISGLFGLFSVWVGSLYNLEHTSEKITVSLLMVAISILFLANKPFARIRYGNYIRNLLMTLLAGSLLVFDSGWSIFPIVFFILSPQLMIDFPYKIGAYWMVAYTLITGFFMIGNHGWEGLVTLLPYTAGYVFFAFFGWTMVQANREKKRSEQLLADLQVTHQELQRYTEKVEALTIADERNRIAREMHDTLGHRLTIASVQLEGAQRLIHTNPQKVEQILGTVREQVREGLTDLRRTVAMIRASVDEDMPLQPAVRKLVNQVSEATNMVVHLNIEETLPDELPFSHRQALFRAVQEGLTNIERHAGATEVWIHLYRRNDMVGVLISDNGVGLNTDAIHHGLGLTGMAERAALLNGEFQILPRPEGGTQISLRLPISVERLV